MNGFRVVIAWAALVLALLCLVLVVVSLRANGVLLLGTGFVAVFVWAVGGFTRDFWSR
ncbi:hypothetical protein [Microbacterium sp. YY-01]|uniref:hypothetical protein n=1 Tax=Microbacterium sp. YY-01 TaxID=3421634 RepID=UPI003D182BFB